MELSMQKRLEKNGGKKRNMMVKHTQLGKLWVSHIPETINVTLQTQDRILVIETFTWLVFELSLRFTTEITITIVYPTGWVGSLLKSILNNNRPIAFYINTLVLYHHYIWQMSNSTPNGLTIPMCSRWIRQMDVFKIIGCTVFCYCLV